MTTHNEFVFENYRHLQELQELQATDWQEYADWCNSLPEPDIDDIAKDYYSNILNRAIENGIYTKQDIANGEYDIEFIEHVLYGD